MMGYNKSVKDKLKKGFREAFLFFVVAGALSLAWALWDTSLGMEFRDAFEAMKSDGDQAGFDPTVH